MTGIPYLIASFAVLAIAGGASAQNYPSKPVRMIVAFAPGGGSDIMGRILAQALSQKIGHNVIVDNRAGAGGSIGTEVAVRAAPDGYTLQLASTSEVSINRSLYTKLSYDPLKDLAPIGAVASTPLVLVVHPSMPVKDVNALVAIAKSRPGQVTFGSAGTGSTTHLTGELFKAATAIQILHVPYKGAAPALTDLVGGQTQLMFSTLPAVMPLITAQRLRALALTSPRRAPSLGNVPTMLESGVPDFEIEYWYGLFAPRQAPTGVISTMNKHLQEVLGSPDTIGDIRRQGAEPMTLTLDAFIRFLASDAERWRKAVKVSGATAN